MPAASSEYKYSSEHGDELAVNMRGLHIGFDLVGSGASPQRKDSLRGKALSSGPKTRPPSGKSHERSSSSSYKNNASKYTVKEFTFCVEGTDKTDQSEANNIEDLFPDDISDRLHLFDRTPHPPAPRSALKTRKNRVQSAQPKMVSESNSKTPEDLSQALELKKRPASAHVTSITNDNEKLLEAHVWKYDCKESPRKSSSVSDLNEQVPEPFVFGYKSGRILSGKKSVIDANKSVAADNAPAVEESASQNASDVPKCLRPFVPWQVHGDIPQHWIGVDPSSCLVLCPSLLHQIEDLPTVPPKQLPEEELDYIEKICPPQPTKKYQHPWNKRPLPEHRCHHNSSMRLPHSAQVRIYSMDGQLLHETYQGQRTADVVRKEIRELEELMQGKGSHDGSYFVQYQAEITDIQNMLDRMSGRIEEIERREEEQRRRGETPDYFGLRSFYKEHDSVMFRIRQQHELCIAELAALEKELPNHSHFSQQLKDKKNSKT